MCRSRLILRLDVHYASSLIMILRSVIVVLLFAISSVLVSSFFFTAKIGRFYINNDSPGLILPGGTFHSVTGGTFNPLPSPSFVPPMGVIDPEPHARDNLSGLHPCVTAPIRLCHCWAILHRRNNPRHGLCRKVRHSGKRGGGDKRERSSEDRTAAQVLQILPHLHLRLHLFPTRALFPNKKQIQAIDIILSKLSNSFLIQHLSFFNRMKDMKVSHV